MRNSVLENNFQRTVVTLGTGISDSNTDIDVPENGCNGQFPRYDTSKGSRKVKMPLHPLGEVLNLNNTNENIIMLKIDTETKEDVITYLSSPPFTQSDMFLTLETDIKNITGSLLPTLSSSDPSFHSWYSYL